MSFKKLSTRWVASLLAGFTLTLGTGAAYAQKPTYQGRVARAQDIDKIDYRLQQAMDAAYRSANGRSSTQILKTFLPELLYNYKAKGGLYVEVAVDEVTPAVSARLEKISGVTVVYEAVRFNTITIEISDATVVDEIASLAEVKLIRSVTKPISNKGKVTSRAVVAHNVDLGINEFGVTGAGLKVGVLSDSFSTTTGVRQFITKPKAGVPGTLTNARNQDSGDLPEEVGILADLGLLEGTDEGAGMAELIHDIAPGAAIDFHTAFLSESGFAEGILALADSGSDIIVDDVLYFSEPAYQLGAISQAAVEVVSRGIPYFSSAGNFANNAMKIPYVDSRPEIDDYAYPSAGYDLHRWAATGTPFLPIVVQPGEAGRVLLHWNQPNEVSGGLGSEIDLDLYMTLEPSVAGIQQAVELGFISIDPQGDTGLPRGNAFENTGIANISEEPLTVYVAVDHYRGNRSFIPQSEDEDVPLEMRLIFFGGEVEGITEGNESTGGPSSYAHATAPGVIGVGAVSWFDTPRYGTDNFGATDFIDAQNFTSTGGELTWLFDREGNYDPVTVMKPDIAAVNGNNTTFFGDRLDLGGFEGEPDAFPNFFGTSASAPNAAAMAALMLELEPTLTPSEIFEVMKETAIDVTGDRASVGFDATTGWGLIDLEAALQFISEGGPRPTPTPTPTPTAGPGTPVPTPVPVSLIPFRFNNDSDGWTVDSPGAFQSPITGQQDGALFFQLENNNTNTFGVFRSPSIGIENNLGDLQIRGTTGSSSLYRASYTVATDVEAATDVPVLRFRASTIGFNQTAELVITSTRDSEILAASGRDITYKQFFTVPSGQDRLRLFVDVINLDGSDDPNARVQIKDVVIEALTTNQLGYGSRLEDLDFRGETNNWSSSGPIAGSFGLNFVQPTFSAADDGLAIGSASAGVNEVAFGFWEHDSRDETSGVPYNDGRLYRAVFRIKSDTPGSLTNPQFRLRLFDSGNLTTSVLVVDSITEAAMLPTADGREYVIWLQSYPEIKETLGEGRIRTAFDYLLVGGDGNDGDIVLTLESVKIDQFEAFEF